VPRVVGNSVSAIAIPPRSEVIVGGSSSGTFLPRASRQWIFTTTLRRGTPTPWAW
jgi:hypothetical protein